MNKILSQINRAHVFTGLNQMSRVLYNLLILAAAPLSLTSIEQGYWFSFMSLSALMAVADSGFSTIVLQFSAHEFAFLRFDEKGGIVGDKKYVERLSTFFRFALRWAAAVGLVALPVIVAIGFYIMSRKTTAVSWLLPWILYVVGSVFTFINTTLLCFFEGCDSVAEAQEIRAKMNLLMMGTLFFSLLGGLGLYSLSVSSLATSLFGARLIWRRFRRAIGPLIAVSRAHAHAWSREFLPLFLKYSVSWTSGYFIMQMYAPLVFHYHGPEAAGKVGLSVMLWMGAYSLANIWIYVVTPKMNSLISKKDWGGLDRMFFRNLLFSALTFLAGFSLVLALLVTLKGRVSLVDRFVSPVSMAILGGGWFFLIIVGGLSTYLRAHKEEPLVLPSLFTAIYVVFTTYLCGRYLSPDYFFLGFLSSHFWGVPWLYSIFMRKRAKDHLNEQPYAPAYNSNTDV